ncbi:MAG: hypothetical protein HY278_03075 [candidate division NC10 bacterium]|nr:hypothetical protein [candidate division NC10 bacterium]
MVKKIAAMLLALSFIGLLAMSSDALAKRRCPPGTDDNGTNICVPK